MKSIDEIIEQHKGQKILICGNGQTAISPEKGYYDYSKSYKYVWTINGGWMHHTYSTLGFMMDDWASIAHDTDCNTRETKEIRLKEAKIPILTTTEYDEFPAFVRYPIELIIEKFKQAYFGETTSYMVAFALLCGAKAIHFTGTDYQGCKASERACTEFWCGFALAKGVQVIANHKSHFLSTHLDDRNLHVPNFYGYLKETFPFAMNKIDNETIGIDFTTTRYAEIAEFKHEYKDYIARNINGN